MRTLLICAALACWVASTAQAQEPRLKAAALRYVFEQWVRDNGAEQASFITLYRGEVIGRPLDADRPVDLASLSKAITAVCAAQLVAQGVWRAATTSAQVLGTGPADFTLGQLITHSGGIRPDATQGLRWLLRDMNAPLTRDVAGAALARTPDAAGSYFYNNENYAVVGQMISETLGLPYAEACAARALTPAGVNTAQRSEIMGGALPWGGWAMSVRDYARFHYHWFGPNGAYGTGAPAGLRVDIGDGAAYGLGMFERVTRKGRNVWHFGSWCMPFKLNTGTFAAIWEGEWSVVAAYDICIDEDQMIALDRALAKAVYGP